METALIEATFTAADGIVKSVTYPYQKDMSQFRLIRKAFIASLSYVHDMFKKFRLHLHKNYNLIQAASRNGALDSKSSPP